MISIVIPVYNEAELFQQQISLLKKRISKQNYIEEIIVVDGGSSDKTLEIAASIEGLKLLQSEKGRAKQMNAGAKLATQEIIYFLHIDTTPPENFDLFILNEIKKNVAGCFCMKFRSKHPWLILMSWFTKINHPTCRGGDQSLFITKDIFEEIGGYDETYQIYEDNMLIGELYKRNQFTVIQKWVTASPRLYHKVGFWKLQWIYIMVYFKKWRGANPDELYVYFKRQV